MPKKFGINSKAEEARERENQQKKEKKIHEEEKKEAEKWQENDKSVLTKLDRKKEQEQKKNEEAQRKLENKKLYEEEMNAVVSNKKPQTSKLTKAQIQKNQEEALLKSLEKKYGKPENDKKKKNNENSDDSSEENENPIEPNFNHIQREQAIKDAENYSQVIDASGLEDVLKQLDVGKVDKHPEKRMKAAFDNYAEAQIPILKVEFPGLKRSQYMEMIQKNWKKAPENPYNQNTVSYDTKVQN